MSKFVGNIGFITIDRDENRPELFKPSTTTLKKVHGDILKNGRRLDTASGINSDIILSNRLSIVANPYHKTHMFDMKFIEFIYPKIDGRWTISNIEIDDNRMILTLGGVYSGRVVQ